jgi:hypothetical protein
MKQKVTFDEMEAIYQHWTIFDKTGLQTDVFKRQGWSRSKFFEEVSTQGVLVYE